MYVHDRIKNTVYGEACIVVLVTNIKTLAIPRNKMCTIMIGSQGWSTSVAEEKYIDIS